jgi:hypothetical protein
MLGARETDVEVDRGRKALAETEQPWERIVATAPTRLAIEPCPPVPFVASEVPAEPELPSEEKAAPRRRAVAIAVGIVTITALGAFLAAGGRDAKSGLTPGDAPEGSAEVDRVTARGPSADRGGPASDIPPTGGDRGAPGADDQGHKGNSHDSNGGGDSGHQSSGGGGGGGGGGEPSTPLATVKVPGVGMVTVDEPAVPRLPHVEETVPDLPAPDLPLP